jgi:hypothetical protein
MGRRWQFAVVLALVGHLLWAPDAAGQVAGHVFSGPGLAAAGESATTTFHFGGGADVVQGMHLWNVLAGVSFR